MNSQRFVSAARWVAAAAALAGIVTLYRHLAHVNPTTVALTLLLFILLLAAKWGLRHAVAASIAATACYNFYFLPPVGTFTIADPQNWLALFAFLGTSVIASRLSARIREEALEARTRQREVEVLYQLSRELLQIENVAELLNAIPQRIAQVSGASSALLFLAHGDKVYRSGAPEDTLIETAQLKELVHLPSVTHMPETASCAIPLRSGVRRRGVLVLSRIAASDETLEAVGGLVSIAIDRSQALQEVTRSEAAKASEQLRSVMLDSITHELRTPLTSIKASASTLLSPTPLSEEDRRELLTVIDEESDRLNHLVAQAVEMAQLDTQEVHMSASPQSIADLIQSSREACAGTLQARDLQVRVPSDLPLVEADPAWIEKVLCNLLENATKYSAPDKPITISADRREDFAAVSVADRGVGIDPMDQAFIFDKFYRARSLRQHVPGTGMGLAICRAIIEAHEGKIEVTSQPGQGSVFTFTLPLAYQQQSADRDLYERNSA